MNPRDSFFDLLKIISLTKKSTFVLILLVSRQNVFSKKIYLCSHFVLILLVSPQNVFSNKKYTFSSCSFRLKLFSQTKNILLSLLVSLNKIFSQTKYLLLFSSCSFLFSNNDFAEIPSITIYFLAQLYSRLLLGSGLDAVRLVSS